MSRGHSINFVNHRRRRRLTIPIILESKKFGIAKISYFIISYHFTSFQIFWKSPIILESNHFEIQSFWNPFILESNHFGINLESNHFRTILSSNNLVFHLFRNDFEFLSFWNHIISRGQGSQFFESCFLLKLKYYNVLNCFHVKSEWQKNS